MKVIGVIPARLGSTRLAEKVLKPLQGKPMIQHVWERSIRAKKLAAVIVAADDQRVVDCVVSFGGKAVLTRGDHPNGTSRVAEIAARESADVFINIQGDEPMMHPDSIDRLIGAFEIDSTLQVGTLAVKRTDIEDYENPNVVKVVCDSKGNGIYFSRAPIPFYRDGKDKTFTYLKHLGIYGYKKQFLLDFVSWKPGVLEQIEKLEQLRVLERGFSIRVVETVYDSYSVDTADDLQTVESKLKNFKMGVA